MADSGSQPVSRGRRTLLLHVLRRSLTSRPRDAAWLAFWSSVQALPALASGWVVAKATGDFIEGRAGTARGLEWLGVLGLAAVVGALASRQTYLRVAALVEPVRDDLVRLVVSGALNEATRDVKLRDTGAVARITHQAEIVRDSFAGLLAAGLTFAFTAVSGLVGLGMLVPAVLPFAAAPVGVSLLLFCCLLWPMATRQRTSVLAEEALANSAAVGLAGLRDAIACGAEHHVRDEILDRVSAQATALRALARMSVLRTLCLAVGGWLPLILVLAAAPSLMRGGVSPGAIIGAVTYISGALQRALYTLTQGAGGSGIRLSITLQRILEASGYPQDLRASGDGRVRNTANGSAGSSGSNTGAGSAGISLRGVSFAYGPHAEPVLRAVDLDIADGDHVAVVGPSGIGKSTFAGLVAGLLRPSAGEIRIGPALLSEVDGADLPRLRVLIPQEAYVFAGTLGENLRYLAPGASAAELDASVDAVGLRPLASRVGGYCADLTPSVLSAGERQLIALVRAHLSPARLAILDEATCQLDPDAAARAESAFAARPGTLIVVAHRISSALRARQVLVLDGASVRLGDHMALRTSSPMYRDLLGEWHAGHDPVTGHPRLATACSGAQGAEPTVVA